MKKLVFLERESLTFLKVNIDHFQSALLESILTQIALLLKWGGLGIRSLVASHSQAYWASMAAASTEVDACFAVPKLSLNRLFSEIVLLLSRVFLHLVFLLKPLLPLQMNQPMFFFLLLHQYRCLSSTRVPFLWSPFVCKKSFPPQLKITS